MSEPALSAEEWAAECYVDFREVGDQRCESSCCGCDLGPRHAMAARCLDGQDYGFTWEDVRHNREQAAMMRDTLEQWGDVAAAGDGVVVVARQQELIAWHESMADRIEALLRPES